jgi:AcrR family transcriptional regulator
MPKGFSEREKTIIRAKLLAKGKELFATYGIKKTNIEDLTNASGISKGAFYLFFESKEDLFFDLLTQFEAEFKSMMIEEITHGQAPPRERLRALLNQALGLLQDNALFARLGREDYEQLLRKLPEERVREHLQQDTESAGDFVAAWQAQGITIACAPELVSALMRALFFIGLHEDELGEKMYPQVIAIYIDQLVCYLLPE